MIDVAEAPSAADNRQRHRRRLWIIVASITVLLTGGAGAVVAVSFHYLHAPGLEVGGGYGWLPPDNLRTRYVQAGPYQALVIPARPNRWQTFSVQVYNRSSVTQTIVGLADTAPTEEPERLTISTTSTAVGDEMLAHYSSGSVAIPPDGIRTVRLAHYAGGCSIWGHRSSRSESYTELWLRVRVGAFTRTERIDLDGKVFELRGAGSAC